MAAATNQLTLAAGQQRLSDVYGVTPPFTAGVPDPSKDVPLRQIILQAATAAAFVGSDPTTLSTTIYGNKIAIDGSLVIGPFNQGPIKLSDYYVLGASSILHVTAIPY